MTTICLFWWRAKGLSDHAYAEFWTSHGLNVEVITEHELLRMDPQTVQAHYRFPVCAACFDGTEP